MKKIIGLIMIAGISYGAQIVTPPGIQVNGLATNNNVMVYSDGMLLDSGVAPTNLVSVTNLTADIEELQANAIDSEVLAGVSNTAYSALYLDGTTNKTLIDAAINAITYDDVGAMAEVTNTFTVTQSTNGLSYVLDADSASLQEVAIVLASLLDSLGFPDYTIAFGANGYAHFPKGTFDFQPTEAFTISFHAKVPTFSADQFFLHNVESGGNFSGVYFAYRSSTSNLKFYLASHFSSSVMLVGWPAPVDGDWHSYELTYDGSRQATNVVLKIDDVVQSQTVYDNNLTSTAINYAGLPNNPRIGSRDYGNDFLGGTMNNIRFSGGVELYVPVKTGTGATLVNELGDNGTLNGTYTWGAR